VMLTLRAIFHVLSLLSLSIRFVACFGFRETPVGVGQLMMDRKMTFLEVDPDSPDKRELNVPSLERRNSIDACSGVEQ
jgi:hypothetical protein